MNRILVATAFLLGAAAVVWMGSSFIGSDTLALAVIVVIGSVYTIGFIELMQFRRATATLTAALDTASRSGAALNDWLGQLHHSLQNAVRLRIAGERVGLPAPVMTPYLVGLLVMLGLLGTFAGMVDTLKGAVIALEGTTELQAIRAGLAAPIKGLGLAFGTSVAGVAASAMLGLISTLSRRDRMLATRRLDDTIATDFREFSINHKREETYRALQLQADTLPEVANTLQNLADKLAHMGDQLGERLLSNQEQFHAGATQIYSDLATAVDSSLKDSLAESGRLAGDSIKPFVLDAMAGFSEQTSTMQRQLGKTASEQLEAFGGKFDAAGKALLEAIEHSSTAAQSRQTSLEEQRIAHWDATLRETREQLDTLAERHGKTGEALLHSLEQSSASFMAQQEARDAQQLEHWETSLARTDAQLTGLTASLSEQLTELRAAEEQRGQDAVERLGALESTVATHLAQLGKELEQPMQQLIETASETPRAAAEVIGHLRQQISDNIARDHDLLQERAQIMSELNTLSGVLGEAASEQRDAVQKLVDASTGALQEVTARFTEQVDSQLSKVAATSADFAGSAAQMSSLGEAFHVAVELFNDSNSRLIESLATIEESMDNSSARSDEQMGYYVAQAREIIDQSLLSQREVFEELRGLRSDKDLLPAEAS